MRDFLTTLIECSVSMSALALILMALTPLLAKRYASKWLYYTWLVIAAGLAIPFRFHFRTAWIRADAVPSTIQRVLPGNVGSAAAAAARMDPAGQGSQTIPWVQIAAALWFAGAAAFLLYHGLRHTRFVRMVKRWGEPAEDPRMLEALEKIEEDMGITRRIGLRICSCISSPMMTGFRNPVILLPRSEFAADELPYILRHELVHFKRKDLWFKSLVVFATAIHWFNPVVYLAAKAAALQCEISCDAQVVNGTGPEGRRRYGEAIIGVIRRQPEVRTAFSTNFYGGRRGMKKRIFSILDTKKKKVGIVVLCLVLMGTLGTGAALAVSNKAETTPAAGQNEKTEPGSSRADSLNAIRTIAGKWAEAVKKRDGKAQFDLLSPKSQSAGYDEFSSNYWVTGVSSPWVESYEVSVGQDSAAVMYRYATSTGFAGAYEQTLSFVEQDGKFYIDGFSDPKLKTPGIRADVR
jgi:beta-lactamase regulating signal transducer with metallopeptidase domain